MLDRYFRRKQFRVLASRCSFVRFWLPRPRLLQCGNTQCSKHPVVSSFLQQDSPPTEWFCNQRPQFLSTCDISIQLIQWVVASRTQQPALPRSSCETAPYAQFSLPGSLAVCCQQFCPHDTTRDFFAIHEPRQWALPTRSASKPRPLFWVFYLSPTGTGWSLHCHSYIL